MDLMNSLVKHVQACSRLAYRYRVNIPIVVDLVIVESEPGMSDFCSWSIFLLCPV